MLNGYVSHNQRVYTVDRNNSQTWNKPNLGMILPKRKIYGFWLWAELVKIYPESNVTEIQQTLQGNHRQFASKRQHGDVKKHTEIILMSLQ